MPVLNAEKYIDAALATVISHEKVSEILIADGGSQDGTLEIINRLQDAVGKLVLVSTEDNGQSGALNKLIPRVKNKFFLWLNADDFVDAEFIDFVCWAINQTKKRDLERLISITSQSYIIDSDGKFLRYQPGLPDRAFLIRKGVWFGKFPCRVWNTSITRSAGEFREDLHLSMDIEMLRRQFCIVEVPKTIHTYRCLGAFRHHQKSKTGNAGNRTNVHIETDAMLGFHPMQRIWYRVLSLLVRNLSPRYMIFRFRHLFSEPAIKSDQSA